VRAAGVVMVLALVAGCASSESDHPELVAPALEPPPGEDEELSREQVLAIAQESADPADAIALLDARPFSFKLDEAAVDWFGEQGSPPAVLDYLRKRSKVDWSSLRGDVDPDTPR
jgi:hypothetical protein